MPDHERTQTDAQLVNAELGGSADAHEKSDSVTKESLAVLRARTDFQETFEWLDRDNSGTISVDELLHLLVAKGLNANRDDALQTIQQMEHTDEDIDTIDYDEFCIFLNGTEQEGKDALTEAFFGESKMLYELVSTAMPLWKRGEMEGWLSGFWLTVGKTIDGTASQMIVLILIVLDVMAVMMEIMLSKTVCPQRAQHNTTHNIISNGGCLLGGSPSGCLLAGGGGGVCGAGQPCHPYGCCEETPPQHDWHVVLKSISLTILFIFLAQQFALMICYGYRFFIRFFYVLDFVIIFVSLVFDLFLNTSEAGLMVLLLSWRVLRIVHGLYSSFELHHGAAHKAADEAKEATLDRVASQKQTQKTKAANHKSASGRGPTEVQAGGQ